MPTEPGGPPQASLLGIAAEVRQRIFYYVFKGSKILVTLVGSNASAIDDPSFHSLSKPFHWKVQGDLTDYYDNLTKVNRSVRAESLDILHNSTTMFISKKLEKSRGENQVSTVSCFDIDLSSIPVRFRSKMKSLHLTLDITSDMRFEYLRSLDIVCLQRLLWTDEKALLEESSMEQTKLHELILKELQEFLDKTAKTCLRTDLGKRLNACGMRVLWDIIIMPNNHNPGFDGGFVSPNLSISALR